MSSHVRHLSSLGCQRQDVPSSSPLLSDFDERLCGNAKPFMQSPNHFQRERAPAIENLVHPVAAADEGNEVARLKPVLVHMILDRLHRVRKIELPIVLLQAIWGISSISMTIWMRLS